MRAFSSQRAWAARSGDFPMPKRPTVLAGVSLCLLAATAAVPAAAVEQTAPSGTSRAHAIAQRFAEADETERLRRYEEEMLRRAREEARQRAAADRATQEAEARREAERRAGEEERKRIARQKEADALSERLRSAREQHRDKELAAQREAAIEAARDRLRERTAKLKARVEAGERKRAAERLAEETRRAELAKQAEAARKAEATRRAEAARQAEATKRTAQKPPTPAKPEHVRDDRRYEATSHRDPSPRVYRPPADTNAARTGSPHVEATPAPPEAEDRFRTTTRDAAGRDEDQRARDRVRDREEDAHDRADRADEPDWRSPSDDRPDDRRGGDRDDPARDGWDRREAAAPDVDDEPRRTDDWRVDRPAGGRSTGEQRVAVLLVMQPGSRGIRRWKKTADPMLCVESSCYISRGSGVAAERIARARGFGSGVALGRRAGACRDKLACVFRDVELSRGRAWMQPVDLRIVRHDRREARLVEADGSCAVERGELHCDHPVVADDYVAWIVPESLAERAGPEALEEALAEGLEPARTATHANRR